MRLNAIPFAIAADIATTRDNLEAAWRADDCNLDKLNAYEAAERAWEARRSELRAQWNALPQNEAKDSAEDNANDSEGTEDELVWLEVAIRGYYL